MLSIPSRAGRLGRMRRAGSIWDPDYPFDPAKWPFFYGWMIMGLSALGMLASIPGQTSGVSVFTDPLIEALGITRMELTGSYLVGTAMSGFLITRGGGIFDRMGARRFIVLACALFGLSLVFLSQVDRFVGLIGIFGLVGASMAAATLGFFGIRLFGQGLVTLASRAMIAKWWNLRRGLVMAINGCFVAFGFSLAPRFFDWQIQALGWRGALLANAAAIGLGMSLAGWLFFRDNPEECGLDMDDGWKPVNRRENPDTYLSREYTREEAVRTYAFWILTLMVAFHSLFSTAYTFHILDLARHFAVEREAMLNFFIYGSLISIATSFIAGYLADRTRLRFFITFMGTCGLLFCTGILYLPGDAGRLLLIIGMGCSWGTFPVISGIGYARYFGRRHLGAISGNSLTWMVWGSALGPLIFSAGHTYLGGYEWAVLASLFVYAGLAISGIFVENPSRKAEA